MKIERNLEENLIREGKTRDREERRGEERGEILEGWS